MTPFIALWGLLITFTITIVYLLVLMNRIIKSNQKAIRHFNEAEKREAIYKTIIAEKRAEIAELEKLLKSTGGDF